MSCLLVGVVGRHGTSMRPICLAMVLPGACLVYQVYTIELLMLC